MSVVSRKGRAWKATVPSAAKEFALLDGTRPAAGRYAVITVPVMVLYGSRSDGFYRTIAKELAEVCPMAAALKCREPTLRNWTARPPA